MVGCGSAPCTAGGTRMDSEESKGLLLGVSEAAKFLGLHPETVRQFARLGKIPAMKVGRSWRFRRDRLMAWLDAAETERGKGVILVVDDEASIRNTLQEKLSRDGYMVLTAATGEDAVVVIAADAPDLLILDLKLPGISGVDVMQAASKARPGLPVIVISGYPDGELMRGAVALAPVTIMAKPVSLGVLSDLVDSAMSVKNRS